MYESIDACWSGKNKTNKMKCNYYGKISLVLIQLVCFNTFLISGDSASCVGKIPLEYQKQYLALYSAYDNDKNEMKFVLDEHDANVSLVQESSLDALSDGCKGLLFQISQLSMEAALQKSFVNGALHQSYDAPLHVRIVDLLLLEFF